MIALALCTLLLGVGPGAADPRAAEPGAAIGEAARCKYSVRDVGFVPLSDGQHRLHVGGEEPTGEDCARSLRRLLAELPLTVQRSDRDLGLWLTGPEGLRCPVVADLSEVQDLSATLEPLRRSPLREDLGVRLIDHLGVILLVECGNAERDAAALATVREAVQRSTLRLPSLEKPTELGAHLLVITAEQATQERWLLEPVGLGPGAEPRLGIFFGRGRRLGEVLAGPALEVRELVRRLDLLALSCECDLDRRWLYGPSLLLEWTLALRQRASVCLSFDPESPLVRAEVERILQRGPLDSPRGVDPFAGELDEILLGYSEQSLDLDPEPEPEPEAGEPLVSGSEPREEGPVLDEDGSRAAPRREPGDPPSSDPASPEGDAQPGAKTGSGAKDPASSGTDGDRPRRLPSLIRTIGFISLGIVLSAAAWIGFVIRRRGR